MGGVGGLNSNYTKSAVLRVGCKQEVNPSELHLSLWSCNYVVWSRLSKILKSNERLNYEKIKNRKTVLPKTKRRMRNILFSMEGNLLTKSSRTDVARGAKSSGIVRAVRFVDL